MRVLLADDEALVRAGIRLVLRHAGDIEVVAEAGDGRQAVEIACRDAIDVALVDIRMPVMDGLTAMERIAQQAPGVKVVMLTTFGERENVLRALGSGATGFILKNTGPQELIQAVRGAASGGAILSPRLAREIVDDYLAVTGALAARAGEARKLIGALTDREREVLVMLGAGLSNAEIAHRLYMGEGTVKTHVSHVLVKLRCANRLQAALLAHDAGILREQGE
ncbi:response regulator [Actinoplanes sp. NPDC049681]|uniref:response regulator transcription factor n=1 Tax=Actinoplanes sp. NPDC049681 TaxID=3363905 RepID=UPI003789550D